MDMNDGISGKKILIVEDNLLLSVVQKQIMERMGHNIIACIDNAKDAIIEAKRRHPDLILMDIQLKGEMDGIEAAQKIYKHFKVPVIFLSGSSNREIYKKAQKAGCVDYLEKPVEKEDLENSLRQVFASS